MAPPSQLPLGKMLSSPILSLLCLVYLFSSTALAASAVLGVDLGTEYIKAALVKPGIPLEIVLTKDSRRKEASAVTFKPSKNPKKGEFPERLYGSDAMALSARFPGDVYPNLKALLGLQVSDSVVREYSSRHPELEIVAEKGSDSVSFRSSAFATGEGVWSLEEILAMELQSIQKNAEALAGKGSKIRDLVVTVPPFFTAGERRAVELAADLAGLRILELASDGLAVGLNYAMSRQFKSINEGGSPERHLVFDMGAGSTKATILKFQGRNVRDVGKFNKTIQEVQVLGTGWDRTLGGDALNAAILDDMVAQFVASPAAKSASITAEAVKGHGRATAKLLKEAERLRQILSANANTQASFEGLYEDIDFKYKITRAQFEELAAPYATRVTVAVENALDMAGLKLNDIDTIILHGGASRTPFVQKELDKFVNSLDMIKTNVNSDEAAVFGVGFMGAGLSPSFRVKEIRASEIAVHPVGIKWINTNDKEQHQQLWQPTSLLGAEKQFAFKNQKDFSINFYQQVPSPEASLKPAPQELLTVKTQNLTESLALLKEKFGCSDADISFRLSSRLATSNGRVEVVKAVVDCEVEFEVQEEKESVVDSVKNMLGFGKKDQAPLSADDDEPVETISGSSESTSSSTSASSASSASSVSSASASPSTKDTKDSKDTKASIVKRVEAIPVKYTIETKGLPQPSASEIKRMKNRLAAFGDSDRSRQLREESLNQLEAFTYKVRDLLEDEEFIAASTEKEKAALETKSKAASEWIYSGGTEASREVLKSKLKEMQDIVTPIEIRREEAATRPEKLKQLQQSLNQTQVMIAGITEQIANDTKNHEAFSSSKSSAAAASVTPKPSVEVKDDFEGLEEEPATTTDDEPLPEATLDPPVYKKDDLIKPQTAYDTISKWLSEKLAQQDKLDITADPVLFTKDLAAKAKELEDLQVELIMKSMKQPFKSSRPPKKSKKPKKSSKTKSSTKTRTISADKPEDTIEWEDEPAFRVGEGGKMPTEEEILGYFDKKTKEEIKAAKEKGNKEKKPGSSSKVHKVDEL